MSTSPPLGPDTLVLKRPHLRLEGRDLFFMISRRPLTALAEAELPVWQALDGAPTVAALRARLGPGCDAAVASLWARELCELAESGWPAGRRRVLVFEPHSDDAALSVGATMWQRRHACEFTVVTMGGRSNFTSYYYLGRDHFDAAEVSALRAAEGELFTRTLGGRYLPLPQDEAPLRYHGGPWTLEWFQRHRGSISAFDNHRSGEAELAAWKASARAVILANPAEELWFPLGVGTHTDHELTRNALLDLLIEEPALAAGAELRLFQDAPYDGHFPHHTAAILASLERCGAVLVREPQDVAAAFPWKLRAVSAFASQFKRSAVEADLTRSAEAAAGGQGGRVEALYRLVRRPTSREPLETWVDAEVVKAAAPRFLPWIRSLRRARRLRLLLLMPAGRFKEDVELLLRIFPRAEVDVYATPPCTPEIEAFSSPRVRLHQVRRGGAAWALLALRLALKRPALTMFAAGDRLAQARKLARLWPGSHPVVLPSLDHFMRGLRQAMTRAGEPLDPPPPRAT